MTKQKRGWALLRLALVVGALVACIVSMGASGCQSNLTKAATAADSIASSLHTAANVNHDVYASGLETLEERQLVASYIEQAVHANEAFVAELRTLQKSGGTVSAASVVTALDTLTTQINLLESEGVLHLKSADAQAKFAIVMASIQAQINVLKGLVSTNNSWLGTFGSGGAVMALTLSAEEIEQLLALALAAFGEGAALVAKLRALAGKSDEELLTEAEAENAAALKQAEADQGAD